MGAFKDLLRDLAESGLTHREVCLKRAREAEAAHEWDQASTWYEEAQEWERAGDAHLSLWRSTGYHQYKQYSPERAGDCYFKARSFSKMREVFLEAFSANASLGPHPVEIVRKLEQAGELASFMGAILGAHPGPDMPKIEVGNVSREAIEVRGLFNALHEAKEASHAARLFLHYRSVLKYKMYDAIKALLDAGQASEALELCRFLEKEKLLSEGDYQNLIKVFAAAGAFEGVREFAVAYLALKPNFFVPQFVKTELNDQTQWKAVLDHASTKDPRALGQALHDLGRSYAAEVGEVEADALLRCYEAVGPREFLHRERLTGSGTTTEWLLYLADYWKRNGNVANESQIRLRYLKETAGAGKEVALDEVESAADMHVRNGAFAEAAALYADAAQAALDRSHATISREYHLRAAALFQRAGDEKKAADVLRQAGRHSKADRVMGKPRYEMSEGESLWSLFEVDDIIRSSRTKEEPPGWFEGDQSLEELLASSVERLTDPGVSLLSLFRKLHWLSEKSSVATRVRQTSTFFRDHGLVLNAATLWLMNGNVDEFERVCIEEDELEVAAVWYEQANMPERAAKIWDLMGQSGKSGNPQPEVTKQKPRDARQPESDSTVEPREETLDQLVCLECGAELKPHWAACPKCDADLQQRRCRNCGEPLEPDWKKCPACRVAV